MEMRVCLLYLHRSEDKADWEKSNWEIGKLNIQFENFPPDSYRDQNSKIMIKWITKKFDDLTPVELYAILQLRNEVFIVEQNCVYQDLDNKDQQAWHLMGWMEKQLVAYTRLIPPGISYTEASIGRVVTSPLERRTGLGRELMQQSLDEIRKLFGEGPVRIGAQLYLKKFYTSLGFIPTSEIYLEDGIEHIEMVKALI